MKSSLSSLTCALALFLVVGCGGAHDPAADIVATAPTGHFGGTAWSMTKASISNDGTTLSVHAFGDTVADCAITSASTGFLLFSMPAKVGKRPLKFSFDFTDPTNQTVTFVTPPSDNNIATDGILDLKELTATSVTLGVLAKAGTGFDVNGTITATLCP